METYKQNPDFVHIGKKLIFWFLKYGRNLPFRKASSPYKIWISEIIFQQTRIAQGMEHYTKFIKRFPDVISLAEAKEEEVMLYWKGLGYYSRALNLHAAAQQIMTKFKGVFPREYTDILTLKGVGKYTAAAIASIAYGDAYPAVDGNFYRVLSRLFADDFDISHTKAFEHFSNLALLIMPPKEAGIFNEAMMDLGSEICKPKNTLCEICPISENCLAFQTGKVNEFPIKRNTIKKNTEQITYSFITDEKRFLIRKRGKDSIWKSLYEFFPGIPQIFHNKVKNIYKVQRTLTHKHLRISIHYISVSSKELENFALENNCSIAPLESYTDYAYPQPLQIYLETQV